MRQRDVYSLVAARKDWDNVGVMGHPCSRDLGAHAALQSKNACGRQTSNENGRKEMNWIHLFCCDIIGECPAARFRLKD
jgi:hypothetical protein